MKPVLKRKDIERIIRYTEGALESVNSQISMNRKVKGSAAAFKVILQALAEVYRAIPDELAGVKND